MTKEKLRKEAGNWLRKYLLCCNCEKKCNCIDSNSYCEEQVLKAYVDSAEPREKRIAELEMTVGTLRTFSDEQATCIERLEKENAELKQAKEGKVVEHFEAYGQCRDSKRIADLEAQIEKMKCCGNCAKRGHICVAEEMQGNLCGKNKDKWELRR